VKQLVERGRKWQTSCEDVEMLLQMAVEDEKDAPEYLKEVISTLDTLEKDLEGFEVERLLSGKYDKYGCTVCIQSGAGGTEAQDWAGMLYRMYKRFAERKNFRITITEEMNADFGVNTRCTQK